MFRLFSTVFGLWLIYYSLKQSGDIEGDVPMAKRLRRMSSDSLQDVTSGEELSLYATAPNSSESAQVNLYAAASVFFLCFFWFVFLFASHIFFLLCFENFLCFLCEEFLAIEPSHFVSTSHVSY